MNCIIAPAILQQSLEYQTAISDVLKSNQPLDRSTFGGVLDLLICQTAARLCNVPSAVKNFPARRTAFTDSGNTDVFGLKVGLFEEPNRRP